MRRAKQGLILAVVVLVSGQAQARDLAHGKVIAQVWCSNCHNVGSGAPHTARDVAPSFADIARRKSTTRARLATLLSTRHGGMPDLSLSRSEIADVSAYILSLRRKP